MRVNISNYKIEIKEPTFALVRIPRYVGLYKQNAETETTKLCEFIVIR